MSTGTIWNHRDFIEREYGVEDAIEFEQIVRKYQAEQIGFEQERIISLMEEHEPEAGIEGGFVGCTCGDFENWYGEHLVALIKGENK